MRIDSLFDECGTYIHRLVPNREAFVKARGTFATTVRTHWVGAQRFCILSFRVSIVFPLLFVENGPCATIGELNVTLGSCVSPLAVRRSPAILSAGGRSRFMRRDEDGKRVASRFGTRYILQLLPHRAS